MHRWYSPRGARRGLLLASVTALLWIVWAAGYTQGATTTPKSPASPRTTFTPVNVVCCLRQLDT